MAASVLSQTSSHFSQGSEGYSPTMYQNFPNYEGFPSDGQQNYMYGTEQPQMQYSATDNWANQANTLRRVPSRSPSTQLERTPIRHHKSSVSRSRSTSRSEALLAYATEQSVQSQQQSANTTPSMAQPTPVSSPGMFHTPNYTSSALTSPYSQQATYYENPSPSFSEMHGQANSVSQSLPDYIASNRTEMQMHLGTSLNPHEAIYLQGQTQVRPPQMAGLQAGNMRFASLGRPLESTTGGIEVSSSRNKPQCWEHGCNGRQFSTFSNLLRHQREKSGTAAKAKCPHCGTEFTRTTARNGHMYGGKCKGLTDSSRRSPGSGDGHSDIDGQ